MKKSERRTGRKEKKEKRDRKKERRIHGYKLLLSKERKKEKKKERKKNERVFFQLSPNENV